MNKFRFTVKDNDTQINLPFQVKFENVGREDLLQDYENNVIKEIINPIEDFETTRYSHKDWDIRGTLRTSTTYSFSFFDRSKSVSNVLSSESNLWVADYNFVSPSVFTNFSGITFTDKELYYYANSFKRSFFKLDFYDSVEPENQQIYFTIIIPTQQGRFENTDIGTQSVPKPVKVRRPIFDLNFTGDKEGYFIYWLKSREYIPYNEFYMSAKFFNAKEGQFVRMMNRPQSGLSDKFNFDKKEYFYYKVVLDDTNYLYEIYKTWGNQGRVGTSVENIVWYEYVNPQ